MAIAAKPPLKRRLWRITEGDPKGKYVDADTARRAETKPVSETHSGWAMSSFELKYGLDVSDAEDTVPAEFIEKLFNGRPS